MRLRTENTKCKAQIERKDKELKGKQKVLEVEERNINTLWRSYSQQSCKCGAGEDACTDPY